MKKILGYLRDYIKSLDLLTFVLASMFIALAIFANYHFRINTAIGRLPEGGQYLSWYAIFLGVFSFGYLLVNIRGRTANWTREFLVLLLLAPAIFSWKMVYDLDLNISSNAYINDYWNQVIYWPFKLLVLSAVLFLIWKMQNSGEPFYGLKSRGFEARPYWIMLLIMVPLITAASTQPDFLAMYPKLKNISYLRKENHPGLYQILYELSYGSDFISIELFFRGFLVLAFAKWFGKDAIIPMALFYCTIHFGKPLGECISSYFGGLILGVVTFRTGTILRGLMVHLGIAWLMELGGFLGNLWK